MEALRTWRNQKAAKKGNATGARDHASCIRPAKACPKLLMLEVPFRGIFCTAATAWVGCSARPGPWGMLGRLQSAMLSVSALCDRWVRILLATEQFRGRACHANVAICDTLCTPHVRSTRCSPWTSNQPSRSPARCCSDQASTQLTLQHSYQTAFPPLCFQGL